MRLLLASALAFAVPSAVAAQCEAEAVPDRAGDVRRLVNHALGSATVREAADYPHWREVYACTPVGELDQCAVGIWIQ